MPTEDQVFSESVAELLREAPKPIRNFILNELPTATERLMQRHQLHIDQGGVLEAELLLLLTGQSTPAEFVNALEEAGVPETTLKPLVEDVNTEIFMRLRKEERTEQRPAAPVATPPAPAPRASVPIYSPLPAQSAPPAPPTYIAQAVERPQVKNVLPPPNLPGQMPERATPPPLRIETPVPPPIPPPQPKPAPVPQVPVEAPRTESNTRVIHTMARDMQALKGGADPFRVAHPEPPAWTREISKPAVAPIPQPIAPVQQPVAASVPPAPAHETVAPHPQEAMRTHLKQYGVDPYREPVE